MKYTCLGLDEYVRGTTTSAPQVILRFKDDTGRVWRQDFYEDIRMQFTSCRLGLVTEVDVGKIASYFCRESPVELTGNPEVKLTLPSIPNLYELVRYNYH